MYPKLLPTCPELWLNNATIKNSILLILACSPMCSIDSVSVSIQPHAYCDFLTCASVPVQWRSQALLSGLAKTRYGVWNTYSGLLPRFQLWHHTIRARMEPSIHIPTELVSGCEAGNQFHVEHFTMLPANSKLGPSRGPATPFCKASLPKLVFHD